MTNKSITFDDFLHDQLQAMMPLEQEIFRLRFAQHLPDVNGRYANSTAIEKITTPGWTSFLTLVAKASVIVPPHCVYLI